MKRRMKREAFSLKGFFQVYRSLLKERPKLLIGAIVLTFAASLAEGMGLALIYPLFDSVIGTGKLQGPVWDTLRRFAESISGSSATEGLLYMAVAIFFMKACLLAASVLVTTLWINRLQEHWRLAALSHYLFGPYQAILGERRGKIIQNILGETGTAARGAEQLLVFTNRALFAFALIGTLIVLNWKLTLALIFAVSMIVLIVRPYVLNPVQRLGRKRMGSKQTMMSVTAEPIFAASTIKLLGVEGEVLGRLEHAQRKQTRVTVLMACFTKAPSNFVEFIVVSVVAIVFLVMAHFFGIPFAEAAPLVGAFAIISSRLMNTLSSLLNMRINLETVVPALPLVERLVSSGSTISAVTRGETLKAVTSGIVFRNVRFGYTDARPVFTDLSVVFPQGKMIGIVGPTGVGKSTLGYLISRLYEPKSGTILINDRDIRAFSLHSLRRRIGYVEQMPAIFNGTIAENICLGAGDVTQADVQAAAQAAGLHEFILSLPKQYDAEVQDQGSTLSGGERQRLAIARAIIRRPDIYIFDEGTSALDSKTEAWVQESIQSLAGNATVIAIAHRLTTLQNADVIYELLPGGQMVERRYEDITAHHTVSTGLVIDYSAAAEQRDKRPKY